MKLFGRDYKIFPKKEKAEKLIPGQYGTEAQARLYFSSLIRSYSHNFKITTGTQILNAYRSIPQMQTIIVNSADSFVRSKKELWDVKVDGTKVLDTTSELYNVLERPHLMQSKNEFWKTIYINWALYGRMHTYKRFLSGFGLESLLCLPSVDVLTVLKKNPEYLNANSLDDIIAFYLLDEGKEGKVRKITNLDSIWTLRESSLSTANNGFMTNENPWSAYENTLGTLRIIAEVKNELLGNHGAIGIVHPKNNKDEAGGSIPWEDPEKKKVQEAYQEYGLTRGKDKLIITNQEIGFTAITLPMAELLLTEFETKATEVLANGKNYPVVLLSGLKQYKNKDAGTKDLFENKLIPESKIIRSAFKSEFKLKELSKDFIFDFSNISALQADQKKESDRKLTDTKTISQINKDVAARVTDRQTGVNRLIDLGKTEEEAERLISPIQEQTTQQNTQ